MNYKKTLLAIVLVSSASQSFAITVFDPSNYVKNTVTSLSSLRSEAKSVENVIIQYKQLENTYTNLKNLNPQDIAARIKDVAVEKAKAEAYQSSINELDTKLQQRSDLVQKINTNYTLSGKGNFSDYVSKLGIDASNGNSNAKFLIDQAKQSNDAVNTSIQRRNDLQKQVQNNAGIMQAAQTTNQYLDVIASQNSDLQSMMAAQLREAADKRQKDADDATQAQAKMTLAKQRQDASKASFEARATWKNN